jgi:hypothetical protein
LISPQASFETTCRVLQVGALCLLEREVYVVRPPYGVVVLAGGTQERVALSDELERGVVRTMAEMRRVLATGEPPARGGWGRSAAPAATTPCAGAATRPTRSPPGRVAPWVDASVAFP